MEEGQNKGLMLMAHNKGMGHEKPWDALRISWRGSEAGEKRLERKLPEGGSGP